jgi:hypothetical protein
MTLGNGFRPGHTSKYGNCSYAKVENGNKIGGKSGKNRGWLMTMLRVLLQGPGCISKYRNCGHAKKIKE